MTPAQIPLPDLAAFLWTVLCWQGVGWWIERGPRASSSMAAMMNERRYAWAQRTLERDHRILDSALLTSLQNGAAFFSSICMFAIGGAAAMIGAAETLSRASSDLPFVEPAGAALWRLRLLAPMGLLTFAFFKFAWAHRLFSYNAVLIGAMPLPGSAAIGEAEAEARTAAALNGRAALNFNRGLRALYFALGCLGWLMGAWGAMIGACLVVWAMWRREFISHSRAALEGDALKAAPAETPATRRG